MLGGTSEVIPMFESFGAFGFGIEDEGIEAGLVDEDSLGNLW